MGPVDWVGLRHGTALNFPAWGSVTPGLVVAFLVASDFRVAISPARLVNFVSFLRALYSWGKELRTKPRYKWRDAGGFRSLAWWSYFCLPWCASAIGGGGLDPQACSVVVIGAGGPSGVPGIICVITCGLFVGILCCG